MVPPNHPFRWDFPLTIHQPSINHSAIDAIGIDFGTPQLPASPSISQRPPRWRSVCPCRAWHAASSNSAWHPPAARPGATGPWASATTSPWRRCGESHPGDESVGGSGNERSSKGIIMKTMNILYI